MIIEGILINRGSSSSLFSPVYFKSIEEFKTKLQSERGLLYGYRLVEYKLPVPTVISIATHKDFDKLNFKFTNDSTIEMTLDSGIDEVDFWKHAVIDKPEIPPGDMWISPEITVTSNHLRARYLTAYDDSETTYHSLEQSKNLSCSVKGGDICIKDYKRKLNTGCSIVFCNGMLCRAVKDYNDELGDHILVKDASKFYKNKRDVNRGTVVVDFGSKADVKILEVSRDAGKMLVECPENAEEYSYLVSLNNRLFTPEEFTLFRHSDNKFEVGFLFGFSENCTFDFKVATGDFVQDTRNLVVEREEMFDMWTTDRAFAIAIHKKGLRAIKHKQLGVSATQQFADENQASEAGKHRIFFDGCARGILFDKSVRAVCEYFLEMANQSIPITIKQHPGRWDRMIAWVNKNTPIERWGIIHNHMSMHASMHDCRNIRGSGFILLPQYEIIDFIFEG